MTITGAVLVDISGYVDERGWLGYDGQTELWSGLSAARRLPVRVLIGQLVYPPSAEALAPARECASVEVCGADPHGVGATLLVLRQALGVTP